MRFICILLLGKDQVLAVLDPRLIRGDRHRDHQQSPHEQVVPRGRQAQEDQRGIQQVDDQRAQDHAQNLALSACGLRAADDRARDDHQLIADQLVRIGGAHLRDIHHAHDPRQRADVSVYEQADLQRAEAGADGGFLGVAQSHHAAADHGPVDDEPRQHHRDRHRSERGRETHEPGLGFELYQRRGTKTAEAGGQYAGTDGAVADEGGHNAMEEILRTQRDDERRQAQPVNEQRVAQAEDDADQRGDDEGKGDVVDPCLHHQQRADIAAKERNGHEGDVDATGEHDHQQAHRHHHRAGGGADDVKQRHQAQKGRVDDGDKNAVQENNRNQYLLRSIDQNALHRLSVPFL